MSPKTILSGVVKSAPRICSFPLVVLLSVLMFAYFTSTTARTDLSSNTPSISEWVSTTPLPEARSDSPTILSDHTIYVLGGRTGGTPDDPEMTDVVYCGTIGPDGNINDDGWRTDCERLPQELCDGAVAMAEDDWLCVTGGSINLPPWFSNAAYYGELEQGRIARWVTATPTAEQLISRAFHASVASHGKIYVIGGWKWDNGEKILSGVRYASGKPAASGKINGWHSATELPEAIEAIYGHAAVEDRGNIYVLGGHNGSTPLHSVYWGVVENEEITWTQLLVTPSLPSLYYHSAVVLDRDIYVIGGCDSDGRISDKVYRATINDDGTLSSWDLVPSLRLPKPLQDHSSVVANDRLYVIGGVSYDGYQNSVYYAPFISFSKSSDPPGEVKCADLITYTIHYAANMPGITLTNVVISDLVPSNVMLDRSSISDGGYECDGVIIWDNLEDFSVESGEHTVSFRVKVSETECGYDDAPTPTLIETSKPVAIPTTAYGAMCPTATPTCTCTDPIVIINRAWIRSDQESREATSVNSPFGIYLPIILKSSN